jgi:hypothetical protein
MLNMSMMCWCHVGAVVLCRAAGLLASGPLRCNVSLGLGVCTGAQAAAALGCVRLSAARLQYRQAAFGTNICL